MTISLSSMLSAFTDARDPVQLQRLDSELATVQPADLNKMDIEALLGIFERFPEDDGFGVFWRVLHVLEAGASYENELLASVRRAPNLFNTLMVQRLISAGTGCVAGVSAEVLLREVLEKDVAPLGVIEQVSGYFRSTP